MAATIGSPTVEALETAPAGATGADRLFAALDQHPIEGGPGGCLVEISGIHEAPNGGAWVQIAVVGDPGQNVLLHLFNLNAVDHAIAALDAWGKTPIAYRPAFIEVAEGLLARFRVDGSVQ